MNIARKEDEDEPTYEIKLAVVAMWEGHYAIKPAANLDGPDLYKIQHSQCAEVIIPYWTDAAGYCLTCYILYLSNATPAFAEMTDLKGMAPQLVRSFVRYAQPMGEGKVQ